MDLPPTKLSRLLSAQGVMSLEIKIFGLACMTNGVGLMGYWPCQDTTRHKIGTHLASAWSPMYWPCPHLTFLQRAAMLERCTSYGNSVRLSVCPSV